MRIVNPYEVKAHTSYEVRVAMPYEVKVKTSNNNKSMAIKYKGVLNQGVEAFNTGKTITANEIVETVDEKALAREIHHLNGLIPEQVAESVLQNFCQAAAQLMAMGYAVVLKNGNDAAIRIYPDVHVKGGNINLARAAELIPGTTDLTLENASELLNKAGVTVRAKAECEQKMTDLLLAQGASLERKEVSEKAYVARKENQGNAGGNNGGGNPNNDEIG